MKEKFDSVTYDDLSYEERILAEEAYNDLIAAQNAGTLKKVTSDFDPETGLNRNGFYVG